MIEGVKIKKLKFIPDKRGFLMEILRNDENIFEKFGQIYLTCVKKNVVKGWHYHKIQIDHFVCISGKALVVLYDGRKSSKTFNKVQEFILDGPPKGKNLILLKIPNGVIHGFAAINCPEARIINIPTKVYNYKNPDEFRYAWDSPEIPYHWPKNIKYGG